MKATLLKSSMLRCVLLAAALAPLLAYAQTSSANTCDSSVVFPASVSQGALVFGKVPPPAHHGLWNGGVRRGP